MSRATAGNPVVQVVEVFFLRRRDDDTKSDITVRGWVNVHADGTTVPMWDSHRGPGAGPHEFRDLKLGRTHGWDMQHCIDALAAFTGQPIEEEDPQMTIDDAPIAAGHAPTIRVGVR